jgi:hypothetical protein
MIDESGFAEPVVVEGGEGDSADPKAAFERSPLKVLASLAERPAGAGRQGHRLHQVEP